MKVTGWVTVALAAGATARFSVEKRAVEGFKKLLRRQSSVASTFVTMVNAPYGKSYGLTGGMLPTRVDMPSSHPNIPGLKTVKMRYGPYTVPSMNTVTKTLTGPEEGMLWNYPDTNIAKPCSTCMITGITADYEDTSGKSVNIDSGQWLHHIVLLSSNNRADPTCSYNSMSLPHWVVGYTAATSERFWASGNERSPIDFVGWNITDVGYRVESSDKFSMIVDLMNMTPTVQTLYVVVKYDYHEGKPRGLSEIKPIWLDVDQCGFSEAKPKSQNGGYTISSKPWRSTVSGEILGMGGHIHDGGVTLRVKVNGQLACDSRASYGGDARYVSPMGGHGGGAAAAGGHAGGHGGGGQPHISKMVLCVKGSPTLKTTRMTAGQYWSVEADYDYRKFKGSTHPDGAQENVMAIGLVYVRK